MLGENGKLNKNTMFSCQCPSEMPTVHWSFQFTVEYFKGANYEKDILYFLRFHGSLIRNADLTKLHDSVWQAA